MAEQWYNLQKDGWSLTHAADVLRSLESDAFQHLGKRSIKGIRAVDVLASLHKVEARGANETARRIR